ncbi:hypothetical protein SAMN06265348_110118 [Pedobacter westerhofensis]|uniref:Uncharacterized protein n=1 Tax=Pedobacter westerhofensis TaxID=425512 RepID=A0A521F4C1_9SPHI|nr:hypothetical protein [Pedobacter westerhofensis]SMO90994.1 hypothetical protein SAMN06265348_110118 [Pedobacter westerhofensis]
MNLLLTIIIRSYVYLLLTFYQFPNYTKHWQGGDTKGHSYASFEEFNGKQDFQVKRDGKGGFILKYTVNLKKGKISMEIKRNSKTVIQRNINGAVLDSVRLDNSNNEKYQIVFRASHAEGDLDIKYN